MLTLRNDQVDALLAGHLQAFLEKMARDLRCHFARSCSELSPAEVFEHVDVAARRARAHGIVRRDHLTRYLQLAAVFGAEFDRDPEQAWAAEIFGSADHGSPAAALDRAWDRGLCEAPRGEGLAHRPDDEAISKSRYG